MSIIEVRDLHYGYEKKNEVLSGVNLSIEKGEKVALLGLNGCGKSTLVKILTGILNYKHGEVFILNEDVNKKRPALSGRFGYVSGQKTALWENFTLCDCIFIFGTIYGIPPCEVSCRIAEIDKYISVLPLMEKQIKRMSFGERIKADITCAILNHPDVLFLDEPFVGLDFVSKRRIIELLNKENSENETTILFTSHNTQEVIDLAGRIVFLRNGIVEKGIALQDLLKAKKRVSATIKLDEPFMIPFAGNSIVEKISNIKPNEILLEEIDGFKQVESFIERFHIAKHVVDISFEKNNINELIEFLLGGDK